MKQIMFILAVLIPACILAQHHHTGKTARYHYYPEKLEYYNGARIRACDSCWMVYLHRPNLPDTVLYFDEQKVPITIKPAWTATHDWRRRLHTEGDSLKIYRDSMRVKRFRQ